MRYSRSVQGRKSTLVGRRGSAWCSAAPRPSAPPRERPRRGGRWRSAVGFGRRRVLRPQGSSPFLSGHRRAAPGSDAAESARGTHGRRAYDVPRAPTARGGSARGAGRASAPAPAAEAERDQAVGAARSSSGVGVSAGQRAREPACRRARAARARGRTSAPARARAARRRRRSRISGHGMRAAAPAARRRQPERRRGALDGGEELAAGHRVAGEGEALERRERRRARRRRRTPAPGRAGRPRRGPASGRRGSRAVPLAIDLTTTASNQLPLPAPKKSPAVITVERRRPAAARRSSSLSIATRIRPLAVVGRCGVVSSIRAGIAAPWL